MLNLSNLNEILYNILFFLFKKKVYDKTHRFDRWSWKQGMKIKMPEQEQPAWWDGVHVELAWISYASVLKKEGIDAIGRALKTTFINQNAEPMPQYDTNKRNKVSPTTWTYDPYELDLFIFWPHPMNWTDFKIVTTKLASSLLCPFV